MKKKGDKDPFPSPGHMSLSSMRFPLSLGRSAQNFKTAPQAAQTFTKANQKPLVAWEMEKKNPLSWIVRA